MDVTHTDFVKCMVRRCEKGLNVKHNRISEERYLIEEWGSLERFREWEKMFQAYWQAFLKRNGY